MISNIRKLITGLVFMAALGSLYAQTNALQQGMEYYNSGSYEKALEYLNQAIREKQALSQEFIARAYYYRGLTSVRLHNEAFTGDDQAAQKLYRDALLLAYRDYRSSLDHDDGNLWKQIDLEMKSLQNPLVQEGLTSLNEFNRTLSEGNPDPKLLSRVEQYLAAAREIRETYLVCDLLGQVYLHQGKKQDAESCFLKSEKLYTEKLPEVPDFLMAYVFYRLASIHKAEDTRLALQDDQRGLNLMRSEYNRFLLTRDKIVPERSKELEDQYRLALHDLSSLRLDLYLGDSTLYAEAVSVFREELKNYPEDVKLLTGYASLLERADREEAIKVYLEVIRIDPANTTALFNIGALYYSKGKDLYETAQKANDDKQFNLLVKAAMDDFKLARTYFEKALVIDPGSLETVQALRTIAYILDDKEAYLKYQEMENKSGK